MKIETLWEIKNKKNIYIIQKVPSWLVLLYKDKKAESIQDNVFQNMEYTQWRCLKYQ